MAPETYDYVVVDDSYEHGELPEAWKRHFERMLRTRFANVWPACVVFHEDTTDADFANDPAVCAHLSPPVASRLVAVFRKLMMELREENELSWVRVFTNVRDLSDSSRVVRASVSDRMCPMIGVGTVATKYTTESLRMRGAVATHKGMEVYLDVGTSDVHGHPKILVLLMVDTTQLSRFGRIKCEPTYDLLGHSEDIVLQWFDNRSTWTYPWTSHAWFDMAVNAGLQTFRDLGCRPVIGSLGVGILTGAPGEYDESVWWEYGNPAWTRFPDFVTLVDGQENIDAYFWLEDAEGRVYDVIRPRVLLCLLNSGHRVTDESFPMDVSGRTKASLGCMGFHYHPAPDDTQKLLRALMMRQQRAAWDLMNSVDPTEFSFLLDTM